MSANAERSPFENIGQVARVPNEMQPRITVREINTAEPGPYYVYIPGIDAEGLQPMLHSPAYSRIPAGEVFKIGAIEESVLAGRLDQAVPHKEVVIMHPIEQRKMDTLHVIAIPAGVTLQALKSDVSINRHILVHIDKFDKLDIEHTILNEMIRPVRVKELDRPTELRNEIDSVGMLAVRLRWLQEAAEKLETGRILEAHRRITDARPFLRDSWLKAIQDYMIPGIDRFRTVAETAISAIEDRLRKPNNTDEYDRYFFRMAWLLGRKPERSVLSRTLEGSRGGLSIDETKAYLEMLVAKQGNGQPQIMQPTAQTMQCPDCGEDVRTIAGGPPRKCRHCGFEFRAQEPKGYDYAAASADHIAATSDNTTARHITAAAEMDRAMPLAEDVEGDTQDVGPIVPIQLSAEDESYIEGIAETLDPEYKKTKSEARVGDALSSILGKG